LIPVFVKFAGGSSHGIGIKNDGTVWTWGYNLYGQLGNRTICDRNIPGLVKMSNGDPLQSMIEVSAGYCYSVALKNDGTVWAWGYNNSGQLGNGTTTQSTYPLQVKLSNGNALTNITTIAAGAYHCTALRSDGTVWAWGYNNSGQLGDGTTSSRKNPVQVKLNSNTVLTNIVAIAAGAQHCIALKSDGTVLTWGWNSFGQLGNGTTTQSTYPVQVRLNDGTLLTNITAIATGSQHCIGLKSDGTVWAWGYNDFGQLGNGVSGTNQKNPIQVKLNDRTALTNVIKISGAGYHSRVLRNDNTLWSWGYNTYGELGNGTKVNQSFPVQMQLSEGTVLTDISDFFDGDCHSFILKSDGTILTCGNNICGQLGDGTRINRIYPVQFMFNLYGNATGANHSIYLKNNGAVWAWGSNSYYQLGDGTTNRRNIFGEVRLADSSSFQNVITVASGSSHTIALKEDGTVWTWGRNNYGQIGNGTISDQKNPIQVKKSDGTFLQKIIDIACGDYHTIVLDNSGFLWAWGYNNYGQLGIGTSGAGTDKKNPVKLNLPSLFYSASMTPIAGTLISSIKAGANHSILLKNDGTIFTWGDNTYGQLGIGTNGTGTNQKNPVQVKMADGNFLTNIIGISGGANHSIALKNDGTVWTWGYNNCGQLGIGISGSGTDQKFPVQVKFKDGTPLTGIVAISGGGNHTIALKSDGTVWTWGYNAYGQLGNGTSGIDQATPIQVKLADGRLLSKIISISGGKDHTIAISRDRTIWAWGSNCDGQLGDGTNIDKSYPTKVLLGSKLSLTEYTEQPKTFTEYAPISLDPGQTSTPTNWNLLDGKYIINVGVETNGSIVWSPGYKLGIVTLALPIQVNSIISESKVVNGNVIHQTTITVASVTGIAGYKYYRRKNGESAECLTQSGTTNTTFTDINLAAHDGFYEYGYSTYNSVGLESDIVTVK
jgi:alpha-tubulin suppressor-like RCC1 family protein